MYLPQSQTNQWHHEDVTQHTERTRQQEHIVKQIAPRDLKLEMIQMYIVLHYKTKYQAQKPTNNETTRSSV